MEIIEGADGDRFWRGDAVEIQSASPDRVAAPCPVAGPGGCGGCDFQHVTLPAQRELKAQVVREQLVRLAKMAPGDPLVAGLVVEAVPKTQESVEMGGPDPSSEADDGLSWRTRVRYATTADGHRGMRAHRSHAVVPIDECLIARADAVQPVFGGTTTETVRIDGSERGERSYDVATDGFWQVHPGAPRVLVETVLDFLTPQPGERALDLYAGVGLFAGFLSDIVGPDRVVAVEGDRTACTRARTNLGPGVRVVNGPVDRVLAGLHDGSGDNFGPVDLVVLDPPRDGARRQVVEQVVALRPRAAAYVACDPAALARDVGTFAELGYRLTRLRAYDLFPMTHHVECVALLEKTGSDLGRSRTV